jgi:hypothetical protein
MQGYWHEIRGPTGPDNANDRAGNAAVHETDQGGSGINQPSRVSRYIYLAPAASVGGRGHDVKVGSRASGRIAIHEKPLRRCVAATRRADATQLDGQGTGVAGNCAGFSARLIAASPIQRKWDGFQ